MDEWERGRVDFENGEEPLRTYSADYMRGYAAAAYDFQVWIEELTQVDDSESSCKYGQST